MTRPVAQLDIEREGLEQLVAFERGEEVGARPISVIELVEAADDAFEIGRWAAVLVERAKPFLIGAGDARCAPGRRELRTPLRLGRGRSGTAGSTVRAGGSAPSQRPSSTNKFSPFSNPNKASAEKRPLSRSRRNRIGNSFCTRRNSLGTVKHAMTPSPSSTDEPPRILRSRWALLSSDNVTGHRWMTFSGLLAGAAALSSARLAGSAVSRPRVRWRT